MSVQNRKALTAVEIGALLPGLLNKIWIKEGEEIKQDQLLFIIETTKMKLLY